MWWVAALVLVADQVTKYLAGCFLAEGDPVTLLPGIVRLTYVRNYGAAFGILSHQTAFFVTVGIAALALVVLVYPRLGRGERLSRWGLAALLGGIAGNLVDRLRFGYVVDFIDLGVWPVFNLADAAIVVGIALVAWEALSGGKRG